MTGGKELGAALEGHPSWARMHLWSRGSGNPGSCRGWWCQGLSRGHLQGGTESPGPEASGAPAAARSSRPLPGHVPGRQLLPLAAGYPSRPGLELQRGAGFQADRAKGSLDKLESPLANWDGIRATHRALPATLAGLTPGLLGVGLGQGMPARPSPPRARVAEGAERTFGPGSRIKTGPTAKVTARSYQGHTRVRVRSCYLLISEMGGKSDSVKL